MRSTTSFRVFVIAGSMAAAALYLSRASHAEVIPPRESLSNLPMQIEDWRGRRDPDFTKAILDVLKVDDYIVRTYFQGRDAALGLYIGYHDSQRQGDTIHSPLNCLPGAGWQPVDQGRMTIDVKPHLGATATTPIEINRVVIGKGLDRQLVLYWYQSHRRVVASEYWGKVYTVLDAVRYNRTDAALVRVTVPLSDRMTTESALTQGTAFIQALFPRLSKSLPS